MLVLSTWAVGTEPADKDMLLDRPGAEALTEYFRQQAETDGRETRERILALALESLEASYDEELYRFSVSARWMPGSLLALQPGDILSVQPKGAVDRYTHFEVSYRAGNRNRSSQVQLSVDIERKLPVASRRILNGEQISAADLELRWVSVPNDRGQLVDEATLIDGKTIRRNLVKGQPVRHADVSSEFLIDAGDSVKMIFEDQGVRIELTGEARQSGAQDDEIRIYSNETRKRYLGRVIGPGVVQWQRTL